LQPCLPAKDHGCKRRSRGTRHAGGVVSAGG
jgi:hypothetical protein